MKRELLQELMFYASNLNVLIVEDENDVREALHDLLKNIFKNCVSACDGVEALKLYKHGKFDIVLTDINMPNKNGIALSKELRILNHEQCIIVLSGYIDTFVIELIDIGIQGLILKPYDLNKFIQILSKNCENILLKKEFSRSKFKIVNKPIDKEITSSINIEKFIEKKVVSEIEVEHYLHDNNSLSDITWKTIEDDIKDYNYQMSELVDFIMLNGMNQDYLLEFANIFRKYYSTLLLVDKLEDFATIFEELSEFFSTLDLDGIDEEKRKNFDTYLYIYDDLINFFEVTFVKKESKDLNYLTDSLKSSIEQMKVSLGLKELEEEELELF